MRILLFLGFLALSMLVPVGLAQADSPVVGAQQSEVGNAVSIDR
jgi:hypothetical protein